MTERNDGTNSPYDSAREESKENLSTVWQNLFVALAELGNIREKPANTFVPTAGIKLDESDPDFEHYLRINPALLSPDGNIEVIVLDVTYLGEPSQQWVAKAEWVDGKPKLVGLDLSVISDEGVGFTSQAIAIYAESTVKKYQHAFLLARNDPTALMSVPDGYSPGIN